jgi:hypothetical protein
MTHDLATALFRSRTRTALLQLLFRDRVSDSMSGLARRAGLSQHSVAVEVKNLARAGLVKVESVGASDLVSGKSRHPAARALVALLRASQLPPETPSDDTAVKETLTAHGAPLLAHKSVRHMPLEVALVKALHLAKRDGSLLKILPVVVAKNAGSLNWTALKETAKREKLKSEVGMLVEMAAEFAQKPGLKKKVRDLKDRRRTVTSFFSEPRNKYERKLAASVTPAVARRWHFLMNLGEETFRSAMLKHLD